MGKKSLKKRIRENEVTYGTWMMTGDTTVAEILAQAGFDWITIDMEHSGIGLAECRELIRVISLSGVAPLVRISHNDPNQVKSYLDCGAQGIIVPMVCSRAEAEQAVNAAYYPPKGTRGVGLSRAQGYGFEFEEYKQLAARETIVIAQIEHKKAVDDIEQLAALKDIDALFIGPYDLSGSLGCPGQLDHELVLKALQKVRSECQKAKKTLGMHVAFPQIPRVKEYIKSGFTMIAYSTDTILLGESCRTAIKELQGLRR